MYAEILSAPLVIGKIKQFQPEEIEPFKIKKLDWSGDFTYIVCIDAKVSETIALKANE